MSEFNTYGHLVDKNSIVYDIGAHIGEMSVQFANNGAKVYAFEPSENNFGILKNNCLGLNIECFQLALHNREYECVTRFKDCRTDYIDENGIKLDTEQNIKYILIEDFINKNNLLPPTFMKIDVEGMESLVLHSFNKIFTEYRPIIYLEIHAQAKDLDNQNYKDNPHWVWVEDGGYDFNKLKEYNYSIIDNNNIKDINEDFNPQPGTHRGIILCPNEKIK